MSRAAVLAKLRADTTLNTLVPQKNIITNFSGDGRPDQFDSNFGFIVLRWGSQNPLMKNRGPRDLTVWAHYPVEKSDDYSKVDAILLQAEKTLLAIEDEPGGDGFSVTLIESAGGWSPDLRDEAFKTIVRNAAYNVLSRPT